jgi:hypothetical protein
MASKDDEEDSKEKSISDINNSVEKLWSRTNQKGLSLEVNKF